MLRCLFSYDRSSDGHTFSMEKGTVQMKKKGFFEHRRYLGYLASRLLGGGFLAFYRRVLAWIRPTLWLRRIFRLLVSFALLLESGALFVLLSVAALLLFPLLAIAFLVLLPSMLRARARAAARLLPLLDRRPTVLLRGDGRGLALRLSCDGYFVLRILASPSLARPYRETGSDLAEISPWLWFSLRRRILSKTSRAICIENLENTLAGEHPDMI